MFEFVKASASLGWAATVLAAHQFGKLAVRPTSKTAKNSASSLMSVVDAAVSNLNDVSGSIYRAGVRVQNVIPLGKK